MKRNRRIGKWILVFLAVAVAGAGIVYWKAGGEEEEPALRTVRVERGNLEVTASSSGKVEADRMVEVKSRASGEIIELPVEPGTVVQAGDLLVRLDPVDEDRNVEEARVAAAASEARVSQARASLAAARAGAEEAREKLARRASAHASGLVSDEELRAARTAADVADRAVDQREADLLSAQSDLTRSRLAIDEAERRREETVIKAPVDGTVLAVNVDRGAIIASGISNVGGGTSLLTLADLSRLLVTVKLDEAQIGTVRKGQEARIRVDAHPEIMFRGVVERVSPLGVTEANIVTFDVRVLVTDRRAGLLRPGMSTDVEIVTDHREDVLLLPSSALRRLPRGRSGAEGAGFSRRGTRDSELPGMATDSMPRRAPRTRAVVELVGGDTRIVVVGASNGSMAVIEEGLDEGAEVAVGLNASRTGGTRAASSPFSPPRR